MSAILVCLPACTMSRSNGRTVAALGAASAIGGGLLMQTGDVDSDHDGYNETVLNDDLGPKLFGALMVVAGIGMVIAGLTAERPSSEADVAWTPTPIVQPRAPAFVPAPPVTVTVTTTVLVSVRTLPEVATSSSVLQMAQQARSAAVHGHCDSAWYMVDRMERQDAAYAAAFSAGPVLDGCPPPR